MSKFSIVGFGGHVQKNIVPAFKRTNKFKIDGVYVRDTDKYKGICETHGLKCFSVEDINNSSADWIYISTPISTHYDIVKNCLELRKNVICEKPLTISKDKLVELYEVADKQKVKLYEVDMYKHHVQFKNLDKIITKNINEIKSLSVKFSIPHLDNSDIRYKRIMGGGALRDVGFYPISLVTSLFKSANNIYSKIYSSPQYEVDLNGAALFTYDNFYCVAEWGIGQPYSNHVKLITENSEMYFDRIFSKPHDFETIVISKKGLETKKDLLGKDDQFINMFSHVTESSNKDFLQNRETSILVHDVMDKIIN